MNTLGHVRTAAARAARTRAKHDRWIGELRAAGWSVLQAGAVTVLAHWRNDGTAGLIVECSRCPVEIREWSNSPSVPLPQVLHAVNSHTCEAGS